MAFFDERLNLDVPRATNLREQSWLGPLLHFVGIAATSHGLRVFNVTQWLS